MKKRIKYAVIGKLATYIAVLSLKKDFANQLKKPSPSPPPLLPSQLFLSNLISDLKRSQLFSVKVSVLLRV